MKISELRYLYYASGAYPKWAEDDEKALIVINELCALALLTEDIAKKHIMKFLKGDINFGQAVKGRYDWCVKARELHPQIAMYKTQNGPVFAVFGKVEAIHSFKIGVAPIESLCCTPDLMKPIPIAALKLITGWLTQCGLNKEITIGFLISEYRKWFSN
jgi:hypothetical protein